MLAMFVLPSVKQTISSLSNSQADQDQVFSFSQSFYLKQLGDSLFVMNDIFRLGLHNQ